MNTNLNKLTNRPNTVDNHTNKVLCRPLQQNLMSSEYKLNTFNSTLSKLPNITYSNEIDSDVNKWRRKL